MCQLYFWSDISIFEATFGNGKFGIVKYEKMLYTQTNGQKVKLMAKLFEDMCMKH